MYRLEITDYTDVRGAYMMNVHCRLLPETPGTPQRKRYTLGFTLIEFILN